MLKCTASKLSSSARGFSLAPNAHARLCTKPLHLSLRSSTPLGTPSTSLVAPSGTSQTPSQPSHVAKAAAVEAFDQTPADNTMPTFLANLRAIIFCLWTYLLSFPCFIVMLALYPFTMAFDKFRRLSMHMVSGFWAKLSTSIFYPVTVVGRENLPPPTRPVMYVANHQSFMDIYSLFHLDRPFKFVSKASIFMIPIMGWSMYLTGHVGLQRMDTRSQLECLKQCRELLDKGSSVLFFPEGTRSKDCVMADWKKGAFSIATKQGVDVVPITVLGAGKIMPSGKETQMYPGAVKIIVHPPISAKGKTADEICNAARAVVATGLPKALQGPSP